MLNHVSSEIIVMSEVMLTWRLTGILLMMTWRYLRSSVRFTWETKLLYVLLLLFFVSCSCSNLLCNHLSAILTCVITKLVISGIVLLPTIPTWHFGYVFVRLWTRLVQVIFILMLTLLTRWVLLLGECVEDYWCGRLLYHRCIFFEIQYSLTFGSNILKN